ncbi:MAG: helix-turn-helix transcriptional regulator [Clostridiales bacterium]|nr:helix-turn-helix transcriptional regulator [Clostridiales bacterium]
MKGLKQKRKDGRWRAQEVASAAGVTISAIYTYEKGTRFPRKETLEKLCKFFDCKVDDLL